MSLQFRQVLLSTVIGTCIVNVPSALSQDPATATNLGPYNAQFLTGSIGIDRPIANGQTMVAAGSPYSFSAWIKPDGVQQGTVTLMAVGVPGSACRCLVLTNGQLSLSDGATSLRARGAIPAGDWTHVVASSDGKQVSLYVNGKHVGRAPLASSAVDARVGIAPVVSGQPHFGGSIVSAQVHARALSSADVTASFKARPNFELVQMWRVGVGWEWQNRANTGLWRQQDPWTLPKSKASYTPPVAKPLRNTPPLELLSPGRWQINGWRLVAEPDLKDVDGAKISLPGFNHASWYQATVPGTVLTTLVDRGVYPEPYYGLNNMLIPEKLARQNYWYRTQISVPAEASGKRLKVRFGGINYASEIWINGVRQGETKGAFIRGEFEFTPVEGANVIAVRVQPAPHPGIPHEQSIAGSVGENGGQLAIDGPTFVATEGWDWIPGIRDRNTGIWRPVELVATGDVAIGDPQIISDLPLPRTDSADIHIRVPLKNKSGRSQQVTVRAKFDNVEVAQTVTVPSAGGEARFSPSTHPQLRISNPKLWWPNGYGDATLHAMTISAEVAGAESDSRALRFGIREVSYDLSLFDSAGSLRRVNVQTTDGGLAGQKLIDVRHEAIKESPAGWAASLTPAGEKSTAVVAAEPLPFSHLTIRVNGVRIAARGGNWGMDDAMKRSHRAELAPYFRLQKEANMNIIRNWMGNNNTEEFFDLADENGMMIMNDFWQSTQNFQVEPQDPALFLSNARDTVARYRNHPSIILWFGRNEGVPHPILNEGLDDVVFELDGTRWFNGSSNVVNLQGSGPYNYRPPEGYFTDLASGFSVETGTPSLSTRESVAASVAAEDRWPLSDTLAYHDWHFGGNGDTKTFMSTLDTMFGAGTSFEDFERKSQMMNLETHKAMYEGFLGHLWTKNSGRLLWMTHPAWPSNAWQIYSHDYDTHAAYYGARKATEPLHIQVNLPDNRLVVVNTTLQDHPGLTATTRVISLDNRELFKRTDKLTAAANSVSQLDVLPLTDIFTRDEMVLVSLTLTDPTGKLVSENFYWRGRDPSAYRALNNLPPVTLEAIASDVSTNGNDRQITVSLRNPSATPALAAKLTLLDEKGVRILPAFYSDNYVSLLPGESKQITVRYPATNASKPSVTVRGWNITEGSVSKAQ